MAIYKIHTSFVGGWVYEIEANSKQEAEDRFEDGNFIDDYMDTGWCGDSQEEIDKIELKK